MFLKMEMCKKNNNLVGYVGILNSFGVHLQCSVTLTVELNSSQLLNTTRGNSTQKIFSLSLESMTSWCHSHWSRCLSTIQRCFHCVTCAKQYCLPSHGGARWPPEQTGSLPSLCCWKFQIHERRKQSDLELEPSYGHRVGWYTVASVRAMIHGNVFYCLLPATAGRSHAYVEQGNKVDLQQATLPF